jgi:MFS family permease
LPLGVVTAVIVFFLVPNTYDPERHSRRRLPLKEKLQEIDLYGLAALVPTIICILLATQWGGAKYQWANGRIIALFVVGFALFLAFVVVEYRQGDRAIVPPSLIKRRTVWACSVFSFCLFGSFLVVCYFLPLWFQAIKGDTATESGIHNLPSILGTTVFSIVAGGMVFGLGYYTWACLLGSILAALVRTSPKYFMIIATNMELRAPDYFQQLKSTPLRLSGSATRSCMVQAAASVSTNRSLLYRRPFQTIRLPKAPLS